MYNTGHSFQILLQLEYCGLISGYSNIKIHEN